MAGLRSVLVSRYFVNERIFTLNSILYFELGKQVFHEHQLDKEFVASALRKCKNGDQALDVFEALMNTSGCKTKYDIADATGLPVATVKANIIEIQSVGLINVTRIEEEQSHD